MEKTPSGRWWINREVERRGIHTPAIEELTATQDPFQVNKPTNIKLGLDSIKQVFGGSSVGAIFDKNHEVTVSEIKEKGYVLAGTEDQDLLKSGKLHDWLLVNYVTYPKSNVAYFLIKRVYTAQYAEISVDQGFDVGVALGGKDTGTCGTVQLPGLLTNVPPAPGPPGAVAPAAVLPAVVQPAAGSAPGSAPAQAGGTPATAAQAKSSPIKIGGTYCHPDKEHVRFFAGEWAPVALELELITRVNDTLDVKPGVVFLPLYDNRGTAKTANKMF